MTSENHFRGDVENCGQISMLQQNFTCGKIIHKIISKILNKVSRNLKVKRCALICKKMKMEESPTQNFSLFGN